MSWLAAQKGPNTADGGVTLTTMDDVANPVDDITGAADMACDADETAIVLDGSPTEIAELAWSYEESVVPDPVPQRSLRSLVRWCVAIIALLVTAAAATLFGVDFYHEESNTPIAERPAVTTPPPTPAPRPAVPPLPTLSMHPTTTPPLPPVPSMPQSPPTEHEVPFPPPPAATPQPLSKGAAFIHALDLLGIPHGAPDGVVIQAGRDICVEFAAGEDYSTVRARIIDDSPQLANGPREAATATADEVISAAINTLCPEEGGSGGSTP